jgi:hypothetical protein
MGWTCVLVSRLSLKRREAASEPLPGLPNEAVPGRTLACREMCLEKAVRSNCQAFPGSYYGPEVGSGV